MASNLTEARQIPVYPYLIATLTTNVRTFLDGLPLPDFGTIEDADALWSSRARVSGGTTPGSAYVVSRKAYERVVAQRY